jgi:S-adenosylmethionine-dependent methyltransferase
VSRSRQPGPPAPFREGVPGWIGALGRLRDVVRQEVLASQIAALPQVSRGPARVLDVGCGQGTQALRAARDGHQVTGIDSSPELLALFGEALAAEPAGVSGRVRLVHGTGEQAHELVAGRFDLVMCHGVLMYLGDIRPMLGSLARVAAPDGALSLLVRNGLALAMRDGLRGRWPEAMRAFDGADYVNRLGLAARAHAPHDVDRVLEPMGWRRRAWFGVRVFTDHRDEPAPAGQELAELLAAEREAGGRDPYRSVAALLHLVYTRDQAG